MARGALMLACAAPVLAGCTDSPTSHNPVQAPEFAAVKFWDANATVAWNERADQLASATAIDIGRLHLYLAMAQFRAAEAAQAVPGPHPPVSAAIAGASAVVLSAFFPASASAVEAAVDAQEQANPWPGAKHTDFAAGEAIGRSIGTRIMAYAQGDLVGAANPLLAPYGPPPTGPGRWVYNGGPIARGNLGARPVFLTSAGQLRPEAPPGSGTPEFDAALDEVREIAASRTSEQTAIALFWNANQSPRSNAAINEIARELIVSYRLKEADAARTLFLMNAAAFDALIGCFDAKYHYWYIRPPQADARIVTTFPTPPHPSYPSAHSCVSGATTEVLATAFPSERGRLETTAIEASMSRLFAGIHYRFDMDAGLALGRAAAALAMAADLDEVAVLP